MKGQIL